MVELYKRLGNKVEVIGINVGINERLEIVRQYVISHSMNFPNLFDREGRIIRAFGVMGTPTHIVIDRKGVVKYRGAEAPLDMEKHMEELVR